MAFDVREQLALGDVIHITNADTPPDMRGPWTVAGYRTSPLGDTVVRVLLAPTAENDTADRSRCYAIVLERGGYGVVSDADNSER